MKLSNVPVSIELSSKGIYDLGLNGSTGKTYLYKLLKRQQDFTPDDILAISYDQQLINTIPALLSKFTGSIIMLDKFDLYKSDLLFNILNSKDCFVFVDMKSFKGWRKLRRKTCKLLLTEEGICLCDR